MEPERKIEKLLRAFAKKRRDEAGPPLELHPATRRLLQSEVARRAANPERKQSFWSFFGRRPVWALGAGIAAAAVTIVLLVQPFGGTRTTEQFAQQNGIPPAVNAPLETPAVSTVQPATPPTAPVPEAFVLKRSQKDDAAADKELAAGGKLKAETSTRRWPPPSATSPGSGIYVMTTTNSVALADAAPALSVDSGARQEADAFNNSSNLLAKSYGGDAAGPARQPAEARRFSETAAGNMVVFSDDARAGASAKNQVWFNRNETKEENLAVAQSRSDVSVSNATPVLAAFAVQQIGRELRVVDGDGSVYSGYFQLESPPEGQTDAKFARQRTPPESYSFQVSGTNRNLKQNVVFSGNLTAMTNRILLGWDADGIEPPILSLSNALLRGTITIGDRQTEIKASPAATP
jgi:hypothetical protein